MVLATQNPIEMEGTYPLPEAQVDRFFFKLFLQYPSHAELSRIADLTTAAPPAPLRELSMDRRDSANAAMGPRRPSRRCSEGLCCSDWF